MPHGDASEIGIMLGCQIAVTAAVWRSCKSGNYQTVRSASPTFQALNQQLTMIGISVIDYRWDEGCVERATSRSQGEALCMLLGPFSHTQILPSQITFLIFF